MFLWVFKIGRAVGAQFSVQIPLQSFAFCRAVHSCFTCALQWFSRNCRANCGACCVGTCLHVVHACFCEPAFADFWFSVSVCTKWPCASSAQWNLLCDQFKWKPFSGTVILQQHCGFGFWDQPHGLFSNRYHELQPFRHHCEQQRQDGLSPVLGKNTWWLCFPAVVASRVMTMPPCLKFVCWNVFIWHLHQFIPAVFGNCSSLKSTMAAIQNLYMDMTGRASILWPPCSLCCLCMVAWFGWLSCAVLWFLRCLLSAVVFFQRKHTWTKDHWSFSGNVYVWLKIV